MSCVSATWGQIDLQRQSSRGQFRRHYLPHGWNGACGRSRLSALDKHLARGSRIIIATSISPLTWPDSLSAVYVTGKRGVLGLPVSTSVRWWMPCLQAGGPSTTRCLRHIQYEARTEKTVATSTCHALLHSWRQVRRRQDAARGCDLCIRGGGGSRVAISAPIR